MATYFYLFYLLFRKKRGKGSVFNLRKFLTLKSDSNSNKDTLNSYVILSNSYYNIFIKPLFHIRTYRYLICHYHLLKFL
jgi:hypothetical protein